MTTSLEKDSVCSKHGSFSAHDERVVAALEQICTAVDKGQPLDRQNILEQYPDVADELAKCLDGLDIIHDAAPRIDSASSAASHLDTSEQNEAKTLGDFRINRELGRGGMGVVYEAEQQSLDRRIALKVLPFASLLGKQHLLRFKNEVRAAAMLKHPHIVGVYQTGCERGVHYYAMELVEGRTLENMIDALRRRHDSRVSGHDPLGVASDACGPGADSADTTPIAKISTSHRVNRKSFYRSVAQLGIQAARALHYAHELGVVHRDVKPSNLLLDDDAKLWISDFGLAQIQGASDVTLTGDVLGTLRYMSPEQASGQRQRVDCRTDVYSLGATLYELATLRPAVGGNDRLRLMRRIEDHDPVAPRTIDEAIPRDLETIIQKAMSKDLATRYASADELADDLGRFLAYKPILARRTTWRDQLSRTVRRNPYIAAFSAVVFGLLATFAISATLAAVRIADLAEETRNQLYDANMNRVGELIAEGAYLRAMKILHFYDQTDNQSDLRGLEWYIYRQRCEAATAGHTLAHGLFVYCGQYSPDGKVLATAGYAREINVWGAETYEQLHVLGGDEGHKGPVFDLIYRNNNELISASLDGTIKFWDVQNGTLRNTITAGNELPILRSLALSPQKNHLAVGHAVGDGRRIPTGAPGRVSIWDLQ